MAIEKKSRLNPRPLTDFGALMEESGEGGRGGRRAPSGFPILQVWQYQPGQ